MTNDPHRFDPLAIENLAESLVVHLLNTEATPLSQIGDFKGAGCYAIYYTGQRMPHDAYRDLAKVNIDGRFHMPVYVGKAVPSGGRKGVEVAKGTEAPALFKRLKEHRSSIEAAENLHVEDFHARWLALDAVWIPLGESLLITRYTPVWNALVDGFGNHNPGSGRAGGVRSRWDTLHPGRAWAPKFPERTETAADITADVIEYLRSRVRDVANLFEIDLESGR